MKKVLFIFAAVLALISGVLSVYASTDIIETRLNYDGTMHNYKAEAVYININGISIEKQSIIPLVMNDRVLVCARDVFTALGCEISWDNDRREVTVKKNSDVVIIPIDKKVIYKNGKSVQTDVAAKLINNYTMIPVRAVAEALDAQVSFNNDSRVVSITYNENKVSAPAAEPEPTTAAEAPKPISAPEHKPAVKGKGIKILFDTIGSVEGNDSSSKRIPVQGLDVLCPTWFAITDKNGTISDVSKASYAEWAHSQGYEVWGLVTNSFDPDITTGFINNETVCEAIIDELFNKCKELGIDGINVDFETIYDSDGEAYVNFMTRLADKFHSGNMTVSVDTYVPAPYNERYHMSDMGNICDYVIMMAYDEHYSTDTTAGSVSSLPWVENWLAEAIGKVPSDKFILACPFYTRAWHVSPDGNIAANAAYGMDNAYKLLTDNKASIGYDEATGQNYGEYASQGNTVKIWLEDEYSLRSRMELAVKYNCGGAAFWRRGFENAEAWNIINEYY